MELLVPLEGGHVGEGVGTVGTAVCAAVVGKVGRPGKGRDAVGVLRASCQSSAQRGWRTWWATTPGVGLGIDGSLAGPLARVQAVLLLPRALVRVGFAAELAGAGLGPAVHLTGAQPAAGPLGGPPHCGYL